MKSLKRGTHKPLPSSVHDNIISGYTCVSSHADQMSISLLDSLQALPLGAVIGGKVLVVHGGLFGKDGVTLGK